MPGTPIPRAALKFDFPVRDFFDWQSVEIDLNSGELVRSNAKPAGKRSVGKSSFRAARGIAAAVASSHGSRFAVFDETTRPLNGHP
ncbi:hypothetical protein SCG7086_AD_00020 [Chlamydiales bacterium SCGC AG-110-P3]|nr:hypothetical protein SCG7086_AD_00020 [Chlamydiales bacterium SCGC AG-110-P3]